MRRAWIFAALALGGFALLVAPPVRPLVEGFTRFLTAISGAIIRFCGGVAAVQADVLRNPRTGFGVRVMNGCNGINVTVFLWAAILSFPAAWSRKLTGVVIGGLAIQGMNLLRIISLYYLVHLYLWEVLIMFDGLIVFALWSRGGRPRREHAA